MNEWEKNRLGKKTLADENFVKVLIEKGEREREAEREREIKKEHEREIMRY